MIINTQLTFCAILLVPSIDYKQSAYAFDYLIINLIFHLMECVNGMRKCTTAPTMP